MSYNVCFIKRFISVADCTIAFYQDLSYALFSYIDSDECWTLKSINSHSINCVHAHLHIETHFCLTVSTRPRCEPGDQMVDGPEQVRQATSFDDSAILVPSSPAVRDLYFSLTISQTSPLQRYRIQVYGLFIGTGGFVNEWDTKIIQVQVNPGIHFLLMSLTLCSWKDVSCAVQIWHSCARLPPARSVLNITASRDVLILRDDISLKDERSCQISRCTVFSE